MTERFAARIHRFGPTGDLRRIYGRKGDGPGEFRNPFVAAFLADSVIVFDVGHRRLDFISTVDGGAGNTFDVPLHVTDALSGDSTIWYAGVSLESRLGVVEFLPKRRELRRRANTPVAYDLMPLLELLGGGRIARRGDTTVVAFGGWDSIIRIPPRGSGRADTFPVPRSVRRGTPPGLAEDAHGSGNGMAVVATASAIAGVAVLSDASIAVLHADVTRERAGLDAEYFLTVLDARGMPVCVDHAVPTEASSLTPVYFRGDSLFLLEQPIDSAGRVTTLIRKYLIRPHGRCMG